jgi:uncharacterized protein (TIGR03083 family)
MSDERLAQPTGKAELLQWIRRERTALEQTLAQVSPAQMTLPGPDGWSIKDHLAHLVAWQQILLESYLGGKSFAEAAGMDEATAAATAHMTAESGLNDYFLARDRALPLYEVLARFQRSYAEVLDALEALDEAALFAPHGTQGRPLIDAIAGDSYEHDQEHTQQIRELAGLA